jgi:hypothetical protein
MSAGKGRPRGFLGPSAPIIHGKQDRCQNFEAQRLRFFSSIKRFSLAFASVFALILLASATASTRISSRKRKGRENSAAAANAKSASTLVQSRRGICRELAEPTNFALK